MVTMPYHAESPFNRCRSSPTKGVVVKSYPPAHANRGASITSFAAFGRSRRTWVAALVLMAGAWLTPPAIANLVEMTFVNPGALAQGGFYVGPYDFTVGSQPKSLVCDDFTAHISVGDKWNANVSTFSDLSQTKFAAAGLQSYGEAAWLYEQGLLHANAWGDIQYAIWAVFNPAPVVASSGWTDGSANWLATAQQQTYTANEFPGISIYTPTQLSGGPQEFIGSTGGLPPLGLLAVPEANILLLVGAGLMVVVWARWRHVKQLAVKAI